MTYYTRMDTPAGALLLAGDGFVLQAAYWTVHSRTPAPQPDWIWDISRFAAALQQFDEYFAGVRRQFDLSLAAAGTPFQRRVWQELARIPYGQTKTYLQIAQAIGVPHAVRAVGAAVGRNPLSIIVPCHRVIGSNGSLTGFAGGIENKRLLLEHEGAPQERPAASYSG
jgi:methylated-DNA-[protein]-cysteine S-methyltransferase